jgi:demethylmenaquinone methyltransferase/2-methoxy-6-polyprenyl-1,4-benzoquinol methylase
MARDGEQTHFGEQTVPLADKQGLVDDVFHSVARRYDLMNDLMSGGLHRAWKDALVTVVNPPKNDKPFALLDLAGGTGDVAFRVVAAGGPGTRVTVCDINAEMLAVGHERATERGYDGIVSFEQGNAEDLPYPDRSFDCVTIAFGIRNVPRIERALAQAFRVLRIGGRFLCLEFSSVDVPGLDKLYELYSFQVIPRIGEAVTGDREAYKYLVESIRKFPKPQAFASMIEAAGFRRVSFKAMTGGVVALHSGWKL